MKFKLSVLFISVVFFLNSNLYPYQAEQNNIQLIVPKTTKLINKQQRTFFLTNNIKHIEISITNGGNHVISFNVKDLSLSPLSTIDLENIVKKQKRKQILTCTGLGISLLLTINTILNYFVLRKITDEDLKDLLKYFTFLKTNIDILSDQTVRQCAYLGIALWAIIGTGIGAFSFSKLLKNRNLIEILEKIKKETSAKNVTIEPGKTIKKIMLVKKDNVKDFTLTVHDQDNNEATTFEVNLAPAR